MDDKQGEMCSINNSKKEFKRNGRNKNIVTEMKNAFCRIVRRQERVKERKIEGEYMSIETSQTKKERAHKLKKGEMGNNIQKMPDNFKKYSICTIIIPGRKEIEKETKYLR